MIAQEIRKRMQEGTEFSVIEEFPKIKGKNRMDLFGEEIQKLLLKKINPDKNYHTEVQGYTKPFTLYDEGSEGSRELCLIGGQVSQFFYSNKQKDQEGLLPIIGSNIDEQANNLWECMNPEKGYATFHFVYWEGPVKMPEGFKVGHFSIYDGDVMMAYRISFRLQRKVGNGRIVILSFLKIKKESWNRSSSTNIV